MNPLRRLEFSVVLFFVLAAILVMRVAYLELTNGPDIGAWAERPAKSATSRER